jgi:hypothetical protein
VRRRGRSLNIKKKEIRDKPLKASHLLVAYLNPNNTLCIVLLQFFLCIIAIFGDLAPQVDLLASIKMTPFSPIQHPYISDLMVSIKVIGKLIVEPKKL